MEKQQVLPIPSACLQP